MADKKLSDVTSVEDFDYFLGVKSNGDVQKMSKDSMKKVISELMSSFLQIDSPKNFIVSNPSNMETGIISIGDASREISKSEKLNEPSEDIPFIRGMDSNGNPIYIGTEQFSSVLAGLIQFPFAYRGRKVVDANNIEDGYYYAENGSTNTNGYFGFLLSAKSDQSAFQILVEIFTGTPYQRAKISNGQWTEWKEL